MKSWFIFRCFLPVILFSVLGFLSTGYHPGAEDDAVYLSAVKADLNPTLYPHDAAFFQLQMRTSVFDTWMAQFVRISGIPVAWSELLWQFLSIFLILWACWTIVCQIFESTAARWGGLAMVSAMFTLPVAGTALFIVDQYLHPRALATALLLFGISRILAGKAWQALPLAFVAFILHPLMGAMGVSLCSVLALTSHEPLGVQLQTMRNRLVPQEAVPVLAVIPFGWVFAPPSATWLEALRSRHWFRVYQWHWYEWLGAIAPLLLFWLVYVLAHKSGETKLARLAMAIVLYGSVQLALAMILLGPESWISFSTLEPMRFLHLVYLFMALVGGAYLGRYLLKAHAGRWALFLLLANGGMLMAQRALFPATTHLELPMEAPTNPWLQAFDWIRHNTPEDAYFALDPQYLAIPGEDFHSFRALAERSQLADAIKDTSVVTKVPELGPEWEREVHSLNGWSRFQAADFERIKAEFGVNWVLVPYPQPTGLDCQWHNDALAACKIP